MQIVVDKAYCVRYIRPIAAITHRSNHPSQRSIAMTISNIRTLTLNGRKVKAFDVHVGRVFAGSFAAPARTANKNLADFID